MKKRAVEEARELLEGQPTEVSQDKKIMLDKTLGQFSVKIPKEIALKAGLSVNSEFKIVYNLSKEETKKEVQDSRLVIYLKRGER